jgi:hypothetical protein
MKTMVEQPKLRPHIVSATNPGGNGVIKFRNGSRILFGARERGFGRGFQRVAIIVFDEGADPHAGRAGRHDPGDEHAPEPAGVLHRHAPEAADPSDVFLNMRHEALSATRTTTSTSSSAPTRTRTRATATSGRRRTRPTRTAPRSGRCCG